MSGTPPNQSLLVNEPELKDALDLLYKDIFLNMNCHAIAQIETFDSLTQTATASVNYKKTYYVPSSVNGEYIPKLVDYPFIAQCPVICLGGGNTSLTFPIEPGDDCLIFFNDRDLDNWFQGSNSNAPATLRLHSFSDAIALVGLRSTGNFIVNYEIDGVSLRTKDGLTKVKVLSDGSKVQIKVGPTMTMEVDATGQWKLLNAAGQDLITTIMNLFSLSTVLGIPIVPSPADFAILTSFKPL